MKDKDLYPYDFDALFDDELDMSWFYKNRIEFKVELPIVQFFQSPFLYSVPNEPQHKTDNNFQQATE
jgi:hypothetical protein